MIRTDEDVIKVDYSFILEVYERETYSKPLTKVYLIIYFKEHNNENKKFNYIKR